MTLRDMWNDYERLSCNHDSPREIAIQKMAFACGVLSATDVIAKAGKIDTDDFVSLFSEAYVCFGVGLQDQAAPSMN